jgi:hypothetical protein
MKLKEVEWLNKWYMTLLELGAGISQHTSSVLQDLW